MHVRLTAVLGRICCTCDSELGKSMPKLLATVINVSIHAFHSKIQLIINGVELIVKVISQPSCATDLHGLLDDALKIGH